ncbi:MAG: hypothetical protein AUH96_10410, partial [Nitrospirae bacterium 13_2_20CM_2_61_4]
KQDNSYNTRDLGQGVTERKAPKAKMKERAAVPSRAAIPIPDDYLEQIERLESWPTAAPVSPPPPASEAMPQRSNLQQASVPVTTQFAFANQRITGYAGIVIATVVVRIGDPDDLLPEGQNLQRLSAGPIGSRLRKAVELAIADLKTEALARGGNGVVGARLEMLPTQGSLAFVTLSGTAVVLE